ncbi:hypothetical protein D9757_013241 [Collybiopsis confluens]|uniref:Uncharacterized protein n=1 Tax=Collybiopsis confluens TaxID=2823264 RepID=A0A8H5FVN9_9AGAR|nr:hypothetical protein D9757_013241 [Collybiopsis confluens]
MAVTTVKAELGGTAIDCLVYGLYLSVFVRAMQVLFRRKIYDTTSLALIGTTVSIFCIITAHLGLDVDRAFRAFTDHIDTPNYSKGYYNVLSGAEALAKNSAYVTITLIADAFLIFRCWAAFGRNIYMILIPSGLYAGNLGTACWALVTFKKAEDPTTGVVIVAQVISRVKFMYITTLCLNLYCSLSIATRIWLVQRQSTGTSGRLLSNTITIVVESGQFIPLDNRDQASPLRQPTAALYSVFLIILITSAALQNPLMYAILNPMPSIVGFVVSHLPPTLYPFRTFPYPVLSSSPIQFSSIIVRVGSGRAFTTTRKPNGGAQSHITTGGTRTTPRSFLESAMRFGRPGGEHTQATTTFGGTDSLRGYNGAAVGRAAGGRRNSVLPTASVHFPAHEEEEDSSHDAGTASATGRSSPGAAPEKGKVLEENRGKAHGSSRDEVDEEKDEKDMV